MPHAPVKLRPGVNTFETQVLNEAAVYSCNLIRFAPDPNGFGLVQKLGGWSRFYPTAMNSTIRALWAWGTSNGHKILSIGCETTTAPTYATLAMINEAGGTRALSDITPLVRQDNVTPAVATNTVNNIVTITDTGANATQYDVVFIPAHISIGGVILFGIYQVIADDTDHFQIALLDSNGNPIIPPTGTSGGTVATFTTDGTTAFITVTLANHGYSVGASYPVLIQTSVGGVTLVGDYVVQTVPTVNTFTISGPNASTSATTVAINGGNARYNFYVGVGAPVAGTGYGAGAYGAGGYGTGVTSTGGTGTRINTTEWTLDNWGDILLACPTATTFGAPDGVGPIGGPIYFWNNAQNTPTALAIAGPVANAGFFVAMPQRQIVAYGSEAGGIQDPLLVRWSDVNNYLQWQDLPTNFAGQFRLTRGSKIVGGMQLGQQGLLLTDVGAWVMRWLGAQGQAPNLLAWGFNEVARGCGLIAQKALGTLNGAAWWMGVAGEDGVTSTGGGGGQFFTMDGNGISPVPCPLWDRVFQNLDTTNLHKIRCATNASFGEIAWYYPSLSGGGEVDSYVKYNTLIGPTNGWDYGLLSRTAWVDQSVFGQPIGGEGSTKLIQQHEISNNADGVAMHPVFRTGFYAMQEGDWLTFVDQFWPDFKWGQVGGSTTNAQVMLTFYVQEYPGDTPRTYGPFTLSTTTRFITPRFRGRLVALQFESTDIDSFWRLGNSRYRFQPDGRFY